MQYREVFPLSEDILTKESTTFSTSDARKAILKIKLPQLLFFPQPQSVFSRLWEFCFEFSFLGTRPNLSRLGSLLLIWGCSTPGVTHVGVKGLPAEPEESPVQMWPGIRVFLLRCAFSPHHFSPSFSRFSLFTLHTQFFPSLFWLILWDPTPPLTCSQTLSLTHPPSGGAKMLSPGVRGATQMGPGLMTWCWLLGHNDVDSQ